MTVLKEMIVRYETDGRIVKGYDAGELIRCKDCKYSSPNGVYGCGIHSFADDLDERMYSDDFCSIAERKEE